MIELLIKVSLNSVALIGTLFFNSLHAGYFFMLLLSSADFFQTILFKILFQEHYRNVKWFGFRSEPTFCLSWSWYKLFESVICRCQKSLLARKRLSNTFIKGSKFKISLCPEDVALLSVIWLN